MVSATKKLLFILRFLFQYFSKKYIFKFKLRLPQLLKAHVNAFPAVQLKKMDKLDLTLKFSSELLVIGLVLFVGLLNVVFFKFGTGKTYSDNSHAFKLLSYHTDLNAKYYGEETSISTVMVTKAGFIAQAQADNFEGLSNTAALQDPAQAAAGGNVIDALEQPSPDSVHSMVLDQIKTYVTKEGDTLRSVAAAHGITVQTLIDANYMRNDIVLKPGTELTILPTDGIFYTAKPNDTLPDIAKKFSGNLETIISYNGLGSAEDIEGGDRLIIPGGHFPLPSEKPAVKPSSGSAAKPKTPSRIVDRSKVGGNGTVQEDIQEDVYDDGTGHVFPKGYCTWYVAEKLGSRVKWGGNAKNWPANSKAYGAVVDKDPAPGAILVTNDNRYYGHVAYIEKVTDTHIIVSEMNYEKFGKVNWREIPRNSSSIKGVIHP